MPILIIIALGVFEYAFFKFCQGMFKLLQALYYKFFASEKQIDEAYKNQVVKSSEDYKAFENEFDEAFKEGI